MSREPRERAFRRADAEERQEIIKHYRWRAEQAKAAGGGESQEKWVDYLVALEREIAVAVHYVSPRNGAFWERANPVAVPVCQQVVIREQADGTFSRPVTDNRERVTCDRCTEALNRLDRNRVQNVRNTR